MSFISDPKRYFRLALAALVFCLVPVSAEGQSRQSTLDAPPHVVDHARLARVDSVLARQLRDGSIAGAVGLVLHDGKVVYERAVGWLDREQSRPMTTDAVFRIASQSKAVTSVAVMLLVEEGKINLNDPASRWLPTFARTAVAVAGEAGEPVPARRAITVRDLLTHTAGISYGGEPHVSRLYNDADLGYGVRYGWYTADREETICETMDRLGTLPFVRQPGEAWVYGYANDILGCIIERASGQSFDVFLRERLTEPLGMRDTHFFLPPENRSRLATVYTLDESGKAVRAPDGPRGQGDYVDGPRRNFSGGAGMLSTARDYARFLEMIRLGGALDGIRIVSPRTIALLTTNQVGEVYSTQGRGYSLAFQTTDREGATGYSNPGSYGWSGAYGTMYEVDPVERLVIVLMIQQVPYTERGLRESFKTAVYQALVPGVQ